MTLGWRFTRLWSKSRHARHALVFAGLVAFAAAGAQQPPAAALPPWADTTGEPGIYPTGDAVGVYRAVLDLLYKDGDKRPSMIVMHDTAERMGDGPCPVKCDRVWPHKSKMDTATILAFARQSPKRPRIRDFGYPVPIKLVSYADEERMRRAGAAFLTAHKTPLSGDGAEFWVELAREFPGAWGLLTLTKVGFNDPHTEALVKVRHSCGEGCWSDESVFLKRIGKGWIVVERIPAEVEARFVRGNLRYRGPSGASATESELVHAGSPASRQSELADAAAVYRAVLDSLYNFQGQSPKVIVLTDYYWPATDTLPAHRTTIDRDLLQKHAFFAGLRSAPEIPLGYRKPLEILLADSISALERVGGPLARDAGIDQPMWLAFNKKYPGAWGMVGLSRVAFDAAHRQAMVYSDHRCGSSCANSDSWVLARVGERWKVVERIKRARLSEWDPALFPLRYVGLDAKPNSYRHREVTAILLNAVTGEPLGSVPVAVAYYGATSPKITRMVTDAGGRIRFEKTALAGGIDMMIGCPRPLSPDSIRTPAIVLTPGLDTTVTMQLDFRSCLAPSAAGNANTLHGAQASISETEARFVFPNRESSYKRDLPLKGMYAGAPEYMWEVSWPISDSASGKQPFSLWLSTEWKAGGPREGTLASLIAGRTLDAMISCTTCDQPAMFADPEADHRNVFATVENGRLVFTVRGREAVRHIFPSIPAAVHFETRVRQVPQEPYGPGDIDRSQTVVVNCRGSDSTAASRRRCDVPIEAQSREALRSAVPRNVRVVVASYDGAKVMRSLDVRITSEDFKAPQVITSTGTTGTISLHPAPNDSVSIEALCPATDNGSRRVSGRISIYIPPGSDTTLQLLVDPRRCNGRTANGPGPVLVRNASQGMPSARTAPRTGDESSTIGLRRVAPRSAEAASCPVVRESRLKSEWNPRSLAGEYKVEWVSDTGFNSRTEYLRLFLWTTSMRDSSLRRRIGPAANDTARHPLFGVMVTDSGTFTATRIRQLRARVDPIYPPVLMIADSRKNPPLPDRYWTALLIGTVGNRRDGVDTLDGAGIGMWIRDADPSGFRGQFEPWGIVVDDRGHYCARRVSK